MKGSLTSLVLTQDANGNPNENEAAVGRELACLRPILLYLENARLLSALLWDAS